MEYAEESMGLVGAVAVDVLAHGEYYYAEMAGESVDAP